jgi:hypothetical protein
MQDIQDSLILSYVAFVLFFVLAGRFSTLNERGLTPFLLIPALSFASLWVLLSRDVTADDVLIYCLFSTIAFYIIGLLVNAVEMPFARKFVAFYKLFNINILYLFNFLLSIFFLPKFAINFFTSESPLSDRISGIQGLSFLFYPYYFLSLGIIVLYIVKKINYEIITFKLSISFFLSLSGVFLFGSRFFPVLVLVGVLFFSERISSKVNIYLGVLGVALGSSYFYLVSDDGSPVLDLMFYRFLNSADIVNYIELKDSLFNIGRTYPFDFLDLIYTPLNRLFPASIKFSSPGPYFFQGDGQGPLPLYLFDSIFYFGIFGVFYVVAFCFLFWYVVKMVVRYGRNSHDDRLRVVLFSFAFMPIITIFSDLAAFNGFFYTICVLLLASVFATIIIRTRPA